MRSAWAMAFALLLASASAHAEGDPVFPPRAIEAGAVLYPEHAVGDETVVVELLVDEKGTVQDANVLQGSLLFADAVRAAAPWWRFEPAQRAGLPVPARIRMQIDFKQPPPPPPPAVAPPEKAGDGPEEVRVGGQRTEPVVATFGKAEVRQLPGAFGDAFRAIETSPGVTPMASGLPYFFVRGAPPGNTGYFLDGIRVPALFHVGVGPSVIHPGLVDSVNLYAGAAPVSFGRFTGGIVSADLTPPEKQLHGQANVRVFDAGALVEAPLAGGKGTALVSGRYGYAGLVLPLFASDTRLAYWDYQTRVTWDLAENDTIGVFAFGSFDTLSQRNDQNVFEEQLGYSFHRIDVRYDHKLKSKGKLRLATTIGYDRSSQKDARANKYTVGSRAEFDQPLTDDLRLRAGADVVIDRYGFTSDSLGSGLLYPPRLDLVWGARADVVWRAFPRVEVTPGIRADFYNSTLDETGVTDSAPAIEPRIMTRWFITPRVTWTWITGIAHQPPSNFISLPGFELGRLHDGLQSSLQTSHGVEFALPEGFSTSATVFLQEYGKLTDAASTCTELKVDIDSGCSAKRVGGKAYGLELQLKRALSKRIAGWISYTYSRSFREVNPSDSSTGTIIVPSEFDRPHVLNVVLALNLGRGWFAGSRYLAYTGRPYTRLYQENGRNIFVAPFNAQRLDGFERLDLRLEKRWQIGERGYVAVVAEGLNVLLSKEAVAVDCKWDTVGSGLPDFTKPNRPGNGCVQSYLGPISIPSLGVEGAL